MSKIDIISLGGVREYGKNMYVVEVDDTIYILDCGLVFPPNEMLGIDVMIPDFSYLIENKDRIAGVFLTHGHADAVGALPYLLREMPLPVFGTELTIELAKIEAEQIGVKNFDDFHVIDQDNEIDFGNVIVKFFKTTHSVPDSIGIVLKTDEGNIVYTGDFKFDMTVKDDYATDFGRITKVGEEGVFALLSDSSQANANHENAAEIVIENAMVNEFRNAAGRVIVAAVASNINRLQQVLNVAFATKRHVFLSGNKLTKIIDVAIKLGKLNIPSTNLIKPINDLAQFEDDQIIFLETGKTGEPLYGLQNMTTRHHAVSLEEGDLVVIATSPTVDMETVVADTKNMIYRAGGHVIELSDDYKSSGHASPKDLQMMIKLLNPKYLVPVSGDFRALNGHADLAIEVGIDPKNIFLLDKGDRLGYRKGHMNIGESVQASNILIDGSGIGDIGNIVLRDRRLLSEDGIFVVVLTISRRLGKILSGPEIISRGFVYMKASEDLLDEAKVLVTEVVNENLAAKDFEWSKLKGDIRDQLGKQLHEKTQRRPMILPVIMEASNYRKRSKKD